MSHTEFLNALAAVCEAAERIPVPRYHPPPPSCCAGYAESGITTTTVEEMGGPPYDPHYLHPSECPPHASGYYSPPVPIATLSCCPPSSASSSSSCSAASSPSPAAFATLLQNGRAFQQYLDDTWPEKTLRRGSAVIRNTLYEKIAETLRGGEATARFKHWVRKSEFFLMEKMVPGMGYGACLAVPAVRGRVSAGTSKSAACYPHRLVARLEDFSHIIASYHNDQRGHNGIRRTYAMVS